MGDQALRKGATRNRGWFGRKRVRAVLGMICVVFGVWLSGVRLYAFPGNSMAPTVRAGDHFVGLVGLWGKADPERFDMVIFDVPPGSEWAGSGVPWMKRVMGLPGEHVRLNGDRLFVDGKEVKTGYLHSDSTVKTNEDFVITLGAEEYCVLGDNLDHSAGDSRTMGPIARRLIKGKVGLIIPSRR